MTADPTKRPDPPPEEDPPSRGALLRRLAERRERQPPPVTPTLRNLILIGGVAFCLLFGALTITVAIESGIDILILTSLAIIGMVLLGIVGAIRNPPQDPPEE